MNRLFNWPRIFTVSICFALLITFTGCGDGHLKTFAVTGQVTVNGKPAEGVSLFFHPQGGSDKLKRKRPWGETDAAGKYELTSYRRADGVPAGKYKVTAVWMASRRQNSESNAQEGSGPTFDRLRGKYAKVSESQIEITIENGGNELSPIDFQTPTRKR